MFKNFFKNLEKFATIYAFGMNPLVLCYMDADAIRELLSYDKE